MLLIRAAGERFESGDSDSSSLSLSAKADAAAALALAILSQLYDLAIWTNPLTPGPSQPTHVRTLMTTGTLLEALTPTTFIAAKLAEFLACRKTSLTLPPTLTCSLLSLLLHSTILTTTLEMANCYSTPA